MIESVVVTLLPAAFGIVVFGGGVLARRKNIDMEGEPPINRMLFFASKYSLVLTWAAMVLSSWGVNLSIAEVPRALRLVALCLWVAGFALLFAGRFGLGTSFRMGSAKEETGLKVGGVFRWSRNPMYVGVYGTMLASVCYTLNPIVFLLAVFVIAVHHKIVLAEERHLLKAFGSEYAVYLGRVRRYL